MVDSPILQVDAVDFVRNRNPILSAVSLTVRAGEHWALLGPNGAGKTTLLKMLGAFEHPTHGSVHVLGHRLGRVDMRELRTAIGHVDPRHNPPYPLTAHEVVVTGLTNTADIKQRWSPTPEQDAEADRLIELMGLTHRRDARWPTLSQGERGRALIARALIAEPRLLLLDEPATGLDVGGREQLIDRIDLLQATHPELASVLVTHHLEELPPATTHVLLLRAGRCVASGPVDEVLTSSNISTCFDHPIRLTRTEDGRRHVRAERSVRARAGSPRNLVIDKIASACDVGQATAPHSTRRKFTAMPTLPWVTVERPTTDTVQIMASRLEVRSLRHVPGFLATSIVLRRQARRSPGALGIALKADLTRRTFWTLSAWTDQAAISAYARTDPHASAIVRARTVMRESTFVFWSVPAADLPIAWSEAQRRIAEEREKRSSTTSL